MPGESDFVTNNNYAVRVADTEQYDNLALFFFSIIFATGVSQRAVGGIKSDFDKARLMAEAMGDMDWEQEDEPEAEAPAAVEEEPTDVFF